MNAKTYYSIIDNEAGNIIDYAETIEPPALWLPIESAPKDGSRILIKEYGTVFVAGWGYVVDDMYGWVIVNDCYIEHSDNLLWMEHPKDK